MLYERRPRDSKLWTRLAFEHVAVREGVVEFDADVVQRRMEGGERDIKAVDAAGRDADNKEPGDRECEKEDCVDK